eukprot:scaffold307559_cov18-Prasinocladus_malaysianus.AAC.1
MVVARSRQHVVWYVRELRALLMGSGNSSLPSADENEATLLVCGAFSGTMMADQPPDTSNFNPAGNLIDDNLDVSSFRPALLCPG